MGQLLTACSSSVLVPPQMYIPYHGRPVSPLEQNALQDLLFRLLDAGPDKRFEDYDEDKMDKALEGLTWMLWLPLLLLRNSPYTDGRDDALDPDPGGRYFMAMYQALNLAMAEPGEGDTEISIQAICDVQEGVSRSGVGRWPLSPEEPRWKPTSHEPLPQDKED